MDGYYSLLFEGRDRRIQKSFHIAKRIQISGKKALLSVITSKDMYFAGEDVHCLIDLQNEDGAFTGELLLEIVQDEESAPGIASTEVTQHGMVLWSTVVPVTLGESQKIDLEYFATIETEGLLLLRGRLFIPSGQELAADQHYFYYCPNKLAITVNSDKELYWPHEEVHIWGQLMNLSDATRDGFLIVHAQGEELSTIPFVLEPGESTDYTASFICEYETSVFVEANFIMVQKVIHVEEPWMYCSILCPQVVDHNPFKVTLVMMNSGKRAVSGQVSFFGEESMVIQPGEIGMIERVIQITGDTTLQAIISGDVSQITENWVTLGEKVSVLIKPESSYTVGDVDIPFSLLNEGILDSKTIIEFQFDTQYMKREYVINAGETISDSLFFTIPEGSHHLTVKTPREELYFDIEGILAEDRAELLAEIPGNTGEILSFTVKIRNTGDTTFMGRLDASTPFWYESVELEIESEHEKSLIFTLPTEPGIFSLNIELNCKGKILTEITQEVEAQHPPPAIEVLSTPSGIYQAGEEITMSFTLQNSGGDGPCEIFLDIPGIYRRNLEFSMEKGETVDVGFSFLLPEDIPSGDYTGIYEIHGVPSTFDFHVTGTEISVSASLDRTVYDGGDTALFTISISPSHSCYVKVNYGEFYTEEEIENAISIAIPVSETGDVFFGIYDAATQRSIYISSILLQIKDKFSIYTDNLLYTPGETVTVTVEPPAPGSLSVYWNGIKTYDISGMFQFSFALPAEMRSGTMEVYYDFAWEGEMINSFFPVKVEGYMVSVYQCNLDKSMYEPMDTLHSDFVFNANFPIQTIFEAQILDPQGSVLSTYEAPLSLHEGNNGLSLDLNFSTMYSGSHTLEYSISTSSITLVTARDHFDVRGPVILGIHTYEDLYMQGEPVSGFVDVYGEGATCLTLYVDDTAVETRDLELSGYEVHEFKLEIPEGIHEIRAELLSVRKSTAYTQVLVMSTESGTTSSTSEDNPDIDMKPLAQYHIDEAEKLKEKAESLLEQVQGIDIAEIEALYEEANDCLVVAWSFLQTAPTIANNWALEAIDSYNEVIALLEELLNNC